MLEIGIDPGTKTGLAVWDKTLRKLTVVKTVSIVEAMDYVRTIQSPFKRLWIEDARKRTWFPDDKLTPADREGRKQGVGSIKRDCSIWDEFCAFYDIKFFLVHPKDTITKIEKDRFIKITGYTGKTSVHARDAAMLVYGR